ncbi:hypothetical protein OsJ_31983 [Oryza sativa Japonica Group]|uniref:Uncharacterized protein n=1 Tax=Oryza sativa subsp. japonica TaxID=39947 RepID=A3C5Z8_ORYSJ|nr:hypothetical protein OsJ_31983 [Oryza sativa Japonica Group]
MASLMQRPAAMPAATSTSTATRRGVPRGAMTAASPASATRGSGARRRCRSARTTPAILTLKVFDHGEDDGGVPTSCDMAPPEHGAGGRAVLRVVAPRGRPPPLPPEDPRLRRRRRGERTIVRGRQGGGRLRLRERVPRGGRVRAAVPEQRRRRVAGGVGEAWAQRERGRIRGCVVLSEER